MKKIRFLYDLVDTHTLRAQGFDVGEVPGACFCCKFDDLVDTISELAPNPDNLPDIVIAEPVNTDAKSSPTLPAKDFPQRPNTSS